MSQNRLPELATLVNQRVGKRELLRTEQKTLQSTLAQLDERTKTIEQSRALILLAAKETQQQLEYRLGELVSLAMETIFPHPYSLRIIFEEKRGRTEARIVFVDTDGNEIDPIEGSGCGPVDVAAFALRLSLWSLKSPRTRNTIILDESFRYVSRDLQPLVGKMLEQLSDSLGVQFIFVTHEETLTESASKVFRVTQRKGESLVKETKEPC